MEDILKKLQKDASGNKHKALRDNCSLAIGECDILEGDHHHDFLYCVCMCSYVC